MADKRFILELGKLFIAAAWADGALSTIEINGLKELLFQLPDISGEEWMELELYMASPVGEDERQRLLERVMGRIGSAAEKALALETLETLMTNGSQGNSEQVEVIQQLRADLDQGSGGFFDHFRRPFRRLMNVRGQQYTEAHDRESRLEDFIKNTIYFQVTMELRERGITFDLPDIDIRKLCLAAGLMARVAGVDRMVSAEETATMGQVLKRHWRLTEEQAQLVAEISHHRIFRGLDSVRLVRRFKELTTRDERKEFLLCLFEVANAADQTSFEEIEEIRSIAKGMDLPHQDFLDAKLTISREDRKGL